MENTKDLTEKIRAELFALRDEKYKKFTSSLIPTLSSDRLIGVRTDKLRSMAKALFRSSRAEEFLNDLPHFYHEENMLHAYLIALSADICDCIGRFETFTAYADNWAVTDALRPAIFASHLAAAEPLAVKLAKSDSPMVCRTGIGLMEYFFTGENFRQSHAEIVAGIRSENYYVNMMRAWYFATALAKNYDEAVKFVLGEFLDEWTRKKAIQKAVESRRIPEEKKIILKSYRKKENL